MRPDPTRQNLPRPTTYLVDRPTRAVYYLRDGVLHSDPLLGPGSVLCFDALAAWNDGGPVDVETLDVLDPEAADRFATLTDALRAIERVTL